MVKWINMNSNTCIWSPLILCLNVWKQARLCAWIHPLLFRSLKILTYSAPIDQIHFHPGSYNLKEITGYYNLLSEESLFINWRQPFGVHLSHCHLMSPPKKKSHSNLSHQFNSPSLCTSLHLLVFLYSQTISPSPWETGSGNITMNKRGWLEICCVRYNSWYLNTLHRGWKLFR